MAKKKKKAPVKKKDKTSPEWTTSVTPYDSATESLMPELEELVKKNPNRLIGCGG